MLDLTRVWTSIALQNYMVRLLTIIACVYFLAMWCNIYILLALKALWSGLLKWALSVRFMSTFWCIHSRINCVGQSMDARVLMHISSRMSSPKITLMSGRVSLLRMLALIDSKLDLNFMRNWKTRVFFLSSISSLKLVEERFPPKLWSCSDQIAISLK